MLLTTKQKKTTMNNEQTEVVIQAENIGVSFIQGYRADDYKSHILNFLRNKNNKANTDLFWPIREVSFKGYKGEVLGIIGSNGSGKTTLCKIISGILQPDEGKIHVDGKVSALFSLGMGFNKELTGRENVYLNAMMLGIDKGMIDEIIEEIHAFSGIGKFFDQPVKSYSSGMKARLGFSVAAYLEPEILIIDEALNTGDEEFSQIAAEKMRDLVQKAKMVILVTHSLKYAKKNCDRLIWLEKGMVRDVGEPTEIIEKYKDSVPVSKKKRSKKIDLQKINSNIKETSLVRAENVGVNYILNNEKFWALKDINFEIKEGEVVGIIGHNGAGKSTLCKLMTKIIDPDQGNLEIKGETTALLGYGTGFNAQLSGKDNIYLNGMLLGIPKYKVEQDYSKIVSFSGLEKAIDKPIKEYSSGMKARLGFSIAATLQPDIFIIDEALSTGDMAFKQKASEKIQEMIEMAKAVIIVSHSMTFVEKVCTRVIWLDKGKIKFDGEPSEAVKIYKEQVKSKKSKKSKKVKKTKKKKETILKDTDTNGTIIKD